MSSRSDIEKVLAANDIVAVIGDHLSLQNKGREMVGLCPFHDDAKPSMTVSPQKQIFKCFACGAGGDVLGFFKDYHHLTFPEALRQLADRAGIELENKPSPQDRHARDMRARLADANGQAVAYYRRALHTDAGNTTRAYLAERGVSAEMIETFQLGYAPDSWDALSKWVAKSHKDQAAFEQAGLVSRGGRNGWNDRLRHRLIFPILDELNRTVAFGARYLEGSTRQDKSDAKYLNSPDTLLFDKSRVLYGMHAASASMRKQRRAVVVEGYMDVIACHQYGITTAVAALGTAFTAGHVKMLRRYVDQIDFVFDADAAGQRAAERAAEVAVAEGIDARVIVLPDDPAMQAQLGGKDPDEILAQPGGLERFNALLDAGEDVLPWLLSRFEQQYRGSHNMSSRMRMAEAFFTAFRPRRII